MGQLGVLVTDVGVREVPVAGTARVYDLGGAGGPVLESHAHLGGETLVFWEIVVGLFVVSQCPVDEPPDVIAVDPGLRELVDEYVAIEQCDRHGVGNVHLRADHFEGALGLPPAMRVGASAMSMSMRWTG